jgi:hypothetical protein
MIRILAGVAAGLVTAAAVAWAQTPNDIGSMRCGTETVAVGDPAYAVQAACGPPDFTDTTAGRGLQVWVYNFGPTQFLHYLLIQDGRLQRIELGDYGPVATNRPGS